MSGCVNRRGIHMTSWWGKVRSLGISILLLLWSLQQRCCTPCGFDCEMHSVSMKCSWGAPALRHALAPTDSLGFCKGWLRRACRPGQAVFSAALTSSSHPQGTTPQESSSSTPSATWWSQEPSYRWLTHKKQSLFQSPQVSVSLNMLTMGRKPGHRNLEAVHSSLPTGMRFLQAMELSVRHQG